jgi:hypothetical protein
MHISGASLLLLLIMLLSIGSPLIKNRTVRICMGVMLAIVIVAGLFGFFG